MTTIYVADINEIRCDENLEIFFSKELFDRINLSKSALYKKRRIASKHLLIFLFKLLKIDCNNLKFIYYNCSGKLIYPFSNINISISYTEQLVSCLISDKKMTIDIEKINKSINKNLFKILSDFTLIDIDNHLTFYKIWTKIEALTKYYDNKTMYGIMKDLQIIEKKVNIMHEIIDENYIVTIVASKKYNCKIIKL